MKLNRCPTCHSHISLEALAQDEASRDLLGIILKQDIPTGTALVSYIGLFRSATRDLSNAKALKLINETLALSTDLALLTASCQQTVEAVRSKAQPQQLKNHNYLKRVIETLQNSASAQPSNPTTLTTVMVANVVPHKLNSKTAQGLQSLEAMKRG